ncbi:17183_t:CDS:1, partial [Racocetra persica]
QQSAQIKEGHIKKDCKELKDSIEARHLFREARSRIKKEKNTKIRDHRN